MCVVCVVCGKLSVNVRGITFFYHPNFFHLNFIYLLFFLVGSKEVNDEWVFFIHLPRKCSPLSFPSFPFLISQKTYDLFFQYIFIACPPK